MLTGCGGERGPALPAAVAERLAARSDEVARQLDAGAACPARTEARALQADAIAAVNAGGVPPALQEDLVASASALLSSIACPSETTPSGDEARRLAAWLRANAAGRG